MERLARGERWVIAALFWPATLAFLAILTVAAITHREVVIASARNPVTWVLTILWLTFGYRALRSGQRG